MTIEEIIINYLVYEGISGIGNHIYAEKPVDPDDAYILIRRTGGSEENFIRSYLIITEVCVKRNEESGLTKLYAADIFEVLLGKMRDIADSTALYGCHKNSDYDATDTESKEYRYQALWEITM